MKILAIETSTDACSVALTTHGETAVEHSVAPQQHAKLLLPMIDRLMAKAELTPSALDAVAYGTGPGSFTGVRIAAAATQGIAFAANVPTVGVSSLHALAQSVWRLSGATHVVAAIDARMAEVYWGAYAINDMNVMTNVLQDQICQPEQLPLNALEGLSDKHDSWVCAGTGADAYQQSLKSRLLTDGVIAFSPNQTPHALDILSIAKPLVESGTVATAADAIPVYIRNKVALTEEERAKGLRL